MKHGKSQRRSLGNILLTTDFKFTFTICMSVIALCRYLEFGDYVHELCMLAVFLSTLADIVMMDYKQIPSYYLKGNTFYCGMAVFMLSHFAYMLCFYNIMERKLMLNIGTFLGIASFLVLVWCALFISKKKSMIFKIAVFLYMMFIFGNATIICTCAASLGSRYTGSVFGIGLFILSDFFILLRESVEDTPTIRKLIWIFYPIGQLMIIFSV